MSDKKLPSEIEFNRPKKYKTIGVLGSGSCGETVHIRDTDMGVDLVVKKYLPEFEKGDEPDLFEELIKRFREEARILFQLNHPNIVRVFNYYDYSASDTGFIVMEFVSGSHIVDYVKSNPLSFDHIFERTIDGFEHLERNDILHRDIRPLNILVSDTGEPKIIDFGFGKQTNLEPGDQEKSISLNWWCDTPPEFDEGIYDKQTEVYFVGKLFEHIMLETSLRDSTHKSTIRNMCSTERNTRFSSFKDVKANINSDNFDEIHFTEDERETYKNFMDGLASSFASIDTSSTYNRDTVQIMDALDGLHKESMLEDYLPDPVKICRIFVKGQFFYRKAINIYVSSIDGFLRLVRSMPLNKREIIMANIFNRLDAIDRPKPPAKDFSQDFDDEIPF